MLTSSSTKTERLDSAFRRGWTPPPRISVPEWADRYRKLAKESGSTSGDWETATVEIARGPMLAVTEPGVHVITVMVSTQLLKTALLENVFGYFATLDPCPMLLLQPKEDAAEQYSKERISPYIRVTPILRALISAGKVRGADETLLFKSFPGGFLAMAGAGSPDNLARRPVRVILADEIDKYPVTREGDPIALVEERTATFVNWLSVRACSPTVEDESRIEDSYGESDQRRATLACPHCNHRQFLDFFKHVDWDKRKDDEGNVLEHFPKTARVVCESCGAAWSEGDRLNALKTARWHQTRPFECCGARHVPMGAYELAWRDVEDESAAVDVVWDWWADDRYAVYRAKCPSCGKHGVDNEHAGFQASKLYSPWPKDKPSNIAAKWLKAKGNPEKEQTWWNTQAGLPYRAHSGKKLSYEELSKRAEAWPAQVPFGVAVITVGADVQGDRIECEVVGWGRDEESWSIDYEIFEGDPDGPEVWAQFDAYLKKIWYRYDGRPFTIDAACVDANYKTQKVYEFTKARTGRRVHAIRGEPAQNGRRSPVWPTAKPTTRTKSSRRIVTIGVNAAKDTIRNRLEKEEPCPGYMHFPVGRDLNYYAQLTAERRVLKTVAGRKFTVWELSDGKRNEALDCRVYAYAALCSLIHAGLRLNRIAEERAEIQNGAPPDDSDDAPVVQGTPGRGPVIKTAPSAPKSRASQLA